MRFRGKEYNMAIKGQVGKVSVKIVRRGSLYLMDERSSLLIKVAD